MGRGNKSILALGFENSSLGSLEEWMKMQHPKTSTDPQPRNSQDTKATDQENTKPNVPSPTGSSLITMVFYDGVLAISAWKVPSLASEPRERKT